MDGESAARLLAQERFRKIEARIEAKKRPDRACCDPEGSVRATPPASNPARATSNCTYRPLTGPFGLSLKGRRRPELVRLDQVAGLGASKNEERSVLHVTLHEAQRIRTLDLACAKEEWLHRCVCHIE